MYPPIPEIKLVNSMTGEKEVLKPLSPGKIKMYSCGPTVYGPIHIGNLRAALVSDLFFRYFQKVGFEVNFIRNYTDVDDRIIDKANAEKVATDVITNRFIQEVEKDYALAGLLEPTKKTRVTEHMPEIIAMISKIIENKHAYVAPDGEVIYSIESFSGYGKLSRKNIDELQAGARVEVSSKKKNPLDFTLWKPVKPGEPSWDSPWGKGRPGWHIECSAMAGKWLGDQMDVHHGGEDLVFPHHENEIAQSEGATGVSPYVGIWVHNAHLILRKEKMSKSLGNIVSARDFLSHYNGEIARYLLLSAHYRTLLDYDDESITHALDGLTRIYQAKEAALGLSAGGLSYTDLRAENLWGEFVADTEKAKREIRGHFANDLNVPGALASLFTLIREWNRVQTEPRAIATPSSVLGAKTFLSVIDEEFGPVTGIGLKSPEFILSEIRRVRGEIHSQNSQGSVAITADEVEALLQARRDARKNKDFNKADEIRKDLESRGIILKDGPSGTEWTFSK